jgi:SAM-dependent methyltransferase
MKRRLLSRRFQYDEGVVDRVPLSALQKERVGEFLTRLRTGAYTLVYEPCPCGLAADNMVISETDRYGLKLNSVLCLECGTIRTDPYLDRPSLDHFYSHLYQAMYARATDLPAYFARQQAYGSKLLETYAGSLERGAAVLEVGCGAGGGLSVFQEAGYLTAGCDYSSELIAFGSERGIANLRVGGLQDTHLLARGLRPALIYLHHVFEHVSDPLNMLRVLKNSLAPEGRALVIVPDIRRVDRFDNPGGDLLQFFHVAHKYNYSLPGLQLLAGRAGLSARRLTPASQIETAWSTAPELWVELTPAGDDVAAANKNGSPRGAGQATLRYLRLTEICFRAGLCRAQLRQRLRGGARRFWA